MEDAAFTKEGGHILPETISKIATADPKVLGRAEGLASRKKQLQADSEEKETGPVSIENRAGIRETLDERPAGLTSVDREFWLELK